MRHPSPESTQLARRINLPLLICYGMGTILGAGIYVLIGKVADSAGMLAPLAFLLAAFVATVTAFSYSQLSRLYPKSAGEAYYIEQGLHKKWLAIFCGYLVVFTGIVSAATLAKGFAGYLSSFVAINDLTATSLVFISMTVFAIWGIAESLWLAALITLIEIAGLLLVLFVAGDSLSLLPEQWNETLLPDNQGQWLATLSGAFLAFYAFIGFEDMVNVAEEVKQPEKNMPKGILLSLLFSTLLYVLVAWVAVLGMPLNELAASPAPLRDLLETHTPQAGHWITLISLFAIINGVLTQMIMASRVLYGIAQPAGHLHGAPALLAKVSPRTRTPWVATITISVTMWTVAAWLPLETLARTTSFIILVIFTLVNLALWFSRKKIPAELKMQAWPLTGASLCLLLLGFEIFSFF